jgi:sec-independent protein translocase protein TatC
MEAEKAARQGEMTFLQHFEELRMRIFRAFYGLVVAFFIVYFFINKIMVILVAPYYKYLPKGQQSLTYTGVTEVFFVYMKIAAVLAIVVASPWIFYQLWAFIAPGLKKKERRWALPFVLATSAFFISGVVFCYYIVLPFTFRFFFQYNEGFTNIVTVSYFWNFELMFLLGIGLTFETPILILLLTRLGIVSTSTLLKKYKWAILIAFIVSAVITPSGDPVTQTIVAVPIIVLYGLGVFISWFFRKRPERAEND